ncbi:MAG: serine hydrolase, partial [Huintestinicola sp.]
MKKILAVLTAVIICMSMSFTAQAAVFSSENIAGKCVEIIQKYKNISRAPIIIDPNAPKETVTFGGESFTYTNTDFRLDMAESGKLVSLLKNVRYNKSFVLYDIESGAAISYNDSKYYPVASTVKAPFVLTCLRSVDSGEHSLNETMTYTSKFYAGGCGTIRRSPYGTVYDLRSIITTTIVNSDNSGYHMLKDHFGYEDYNNFLTSLGNKVTITKYVKWGQTSPMDSLRNWSEIYNYTEGGSPNGDFLKELLTGTADSCIRSTLGERHTVANKMGWMFGTCCHDHA